MKISLDSNINRKKIIDLNIDRKKTIDLNIDRKKTINSKNIDIFIDIAISIRDTSFSSNR